jgi:hypothetical protein
MMMKNRIVGLLLVGLMAGGVGEAALQRSRSAAQPPIPKTGAKVDTDGSEDNPVTAVAGGTKKTGFIASVKTGARAIKTGITGLFGSKPKTTPAAAESLEPVGEPADASDFVPAGPAAKRPGIDTRAVAVAARHKQAQDQATINLRAAQEIETAARTAAGQLRVGQTSSGLLQLDRLNNQMGASAAKVATLKAAAAQEKANYKAEMGAAYATLRSANTEKQTGFLGRFKKTDAQQAQARIDALKKSHLKEVKAQQTALAREAKAAEALAKQAAEKVEKKQAALDTLVAKKTAAEKAKGDAEAALNKLLTDGKPKLMPQALYELQVKRAMAKVEAAKMKAKNAEESATNFQSQLTSLSTQAEAAKQALAASVGKVSVSKGLLRKGTQEIDIAGVKTRQQVKDAKALEKRSKADAAAAEAQTSADTALAGLRTAREKKQDAANAAELAMLKKRAKEQEIAKRLTDRENANKENIKTEATKLGLGAAPTKKQLAAKEAELNKNLEVIRQMQNLTKGDQLTPEQHKARAALEAQIKALDGIRQLRAKKITVTEEDRLAGNAAASQVKMAAGKKAEIGVIADLMRKKGMETAAVPETRDISYMRAATGIGGFARRAIVRVTPGVSPEFALKKMTEAEKNAADAKKREAASATAQVDEVVPPASESKPAAGSDDGVPAVASRVAAVASGSQSVAGAAVVSAASNSMSTPAAAAAAASGVAVPVPSAANQAAVSAQPSASARE